MAQFTIKLENHLEEIERNALKANSVQIGFMENAVYGDGTQVALVAMVQEFGSPINNIPPRPFFRTMIANESPNWSALVKSNLQRTNYDARRTLSLTGDTIAQQLKDSILNGNWAPNAPSTIARKGFDRPLFELGLLASYPRYVVR